LETTTVLFALAIALALLIERFLEVLKTGYDLLDSRLDLYHYWTRRTERLRDKLERKLRVFEYVKPALMARFLGRFEEKLLGKAQGHPGKVPVLAGDLVRATALRGIIKGVGIILGISLAFAANIDLVAIWAAGAPDDFQWAPPISAGVGKTLSGAAIGLGSGPVHKLITTIERRREKSREKGGQ
jgi:hypothetical protein